MIDFILIAVFLVLADIILIGIVGYVEKKTEEKSLRARGSNKSEDRTLSAGFAPTRRRGIRSRPSK